MSEKEDTTKIEEKTNNPKGSKELTESYKALMNLLNTAEKQYDECKDSVIEEINNMGYEKGILDGLFQYKKEDIEKFDDIKIQEILSKYSINDDNDTSGYNLSNKLHGDVEKNRYDINTIKDLSIKLLQQRYDLMKIKTEFNDILTKYYEVLTSDDVTNKKLEKINELKEKLKDMPDGPEKKEATKKLEITENSMTLNFLYDRLDKYGKKEIDAIMNGFFKEQSGSYIVNRYKDKINKYGYKTNLYESFFNIEENFLNSKYSPFNNLFLFIYMRYVAYSDPYSDKDKVYVRALVNSIGNLIYHKFSNKEKENKFIELISNIDDRFIDYTDYFKKNNTSYEGHPVRIALVKEHEKHRREALVKGLHDIGVNDFDENMKIDDLQTMYNSKVDELVENQIDTKDDTDEESSTESVLAPKKINKDDDSDEDPNVEHEDNDDDVEYEDEDGYDEDESSNNE